MQGRPFSEDKMKRIALIMLCLLLCSCSGTVTPPTTEATTTEATAEAITTEAVTTEAPETEAPEPVIPPSNVLQFDNKKAGYPAFLLYNIVFVF